MKLYFRNNEECFCYGKDVHLEYMRDNKIEEMTVREAKASYGTGYFFCSHNNECGDVGFCGIANCEYYSPRNKKNGCCTYRRPCYEATDKEIILKIKLKL